MTTDTDYNRRQLARARSAPIVEALHGRLVVDDLAAEVFAGQHRGTAHPLLDPVGIHPAEPVFGYAAVHLHRQGRRVTLVPLSDRPATDTTPELFAVHHDAREAVSADAARYVRANFNVALAAVRASGRFYARPWSPMGWAEHVEVTAVIVAPRWTGFLVGLDADVRRIVFDPADLVDLDGQVRR